MFTPNESGLTEEQRAAVAMALQEPQRYHAAFWGRPDAAGVAASAELTPLAARALRDRNFPAAAERFPFPHGCWGRPEPGAIQAALAAPEDIGGAELREEDLQLKPIIVEALGLEEEYLPSTHAVRRDNLPLYVEILRAGGETNFFNYCVAALAYANAVLRHLLLVELPANRAALGIERPQALMLLRCAVLADNAPALEMMVDANFPGAEVFGDALRELILDADAPHCARATLQRCMEALSTSFRAVGPDALLGSDPRPDSSSESSSESDGESDGESEEGPEAGRSRRRGGDDSGSSSSDEESPRRRGRPQNRDALRRTAAQIQRNAQMGAACLRRWLEAAQQATPPASRVTQMIRSIVERD